MACLCSEANLEGAIASCMQTACPEDQEVLRIGVFLDKFCLCKLMPKDAACLLFSYARLADPAIAQLEQNIVARQEDGSVIAEPAFTIFPTPNLSTSSPSAAIAAFSSSAPASSRAVISPGVITPTSTSVEAPILTTKSPSPTDIPTKGSSGGLSKGAAAGLAIGMIIGVIALAAGAFLLWRRQKGRWANKAVTNDTGHDNPESGKAEKRAKTTHAFERDAFAVPEQAPIPTTSAFENPKDSFNVSSLPELVSIENKQGAGQQSQKTTKRKDQTVSDDLGRLEEEERRIAAAIANAEHIERLRIEQRAVQSRIQEARGGQS